jgi:hypothetical protein
MVCSNCFWKGLSMHFAGCRGGCARCRNRATVSPDLALDVAPAHHARRFAHQDGEQPQADRRELQILPCARDAQRGGIEHQVGDAQHLGADLAPIAPDQGAQAGFEFLQRERASPDSRRHRLPGRAPCRRACRAP